MSMSMSLSLSVTVSVTASVSVSSSFLSSESIGQRMNSNAPQNKKKMIESINRYKSILSGLVFKNSWSLLRLNDGKNRLLKNRKKRKKK